MTPTDDRANERSFATSDASRGTAGIRVRMRVINAVAIVLASVLALAAVTGIEHVFEAEKNAERINETYRACSSAARDLQEASDYLTTQARMMVVTGDVSYLDAYLEELNVTDRRGRAVQTLHDYLGDSQAVDDLEEALNQSNALAVQELYAMRLVLDASGETGATTTSDLLAQVEVEPEVDALPAEEKLILARDIVIGEDYTVSKQLISNAVSSCADRLLQGLNVQVLASNDELHMRLSVMRAITLMLLAIVVAVICAIIFLILWPLAAYTRQIKQGERLILSGASELSYLADAYNQIYEENHERTVSLQYAAERDALTGLYNRGAYDELLSGSATHVALMLIDVDYFKGVNDTYGHDTGDAVLRKVASLIAHSFRGSDFPCRIGGDEFAVIMTDAHPEMRQVIEEKIETLAAALLDTSDGLPRITISVGVAFSDQLDGQPDLFKAADRALYVVKERGRNGHAFYGEE